MAEEKGCTPAQLALAWLLSRGDDVIPIPGTRRRRHLDDNLGALDVRLSAEELDRLAAVVPPDAVAGERYNAGSMEMLNL
jgi:aryl-alcohol dehydrogenase-like predicted oxidoreductase